MRRRPTSIAHFDVDASEIGKVRNVDWHHVGVLRRDLRRPDSSMAYATDLTLDFGEWMKTLDELKRRICAELRSRQRPDSAQLRCIEEINRHTGGEAIISTGVGQHQMWAAQYLDFREPRLWLTSGSMGTMGFGLPAAIGAQFANARNDWSSISTAMPAFA